MAVTDQQKIDFLLKKIGFTKTKTGNVSGTGDPGEGSVKQPFAEAIPSPLVVPNSSLWNEADSIPATPPGSDTTQVKVYSASSAVRLTETLLFQLQVKHVRGLLIQLIIIHPLQD